MITAGKSRPHDNEPRGWAEITSYEAGFIRWDSRRLGILLAWVVHLEKISIGAHYVPLVST